MIRFFTLHTIHYSHSYKAHCYLYLALVLVHLLRETIRDLNMLKIINCYLLGE